MIGGQGATERLLIDEAHVPETDALRAYWRDPAPFEAEREREQAKINASFAAHRDHALRRLGYLENR